MKISIITSYLPELSSGSAIRLYNLLKHLSLNNDVTLISAMSYKSLDVIQKFKSQVHDKVYTFELPKISFLDRIRYYSINKVPYVERLKHSSFNTILNYIPNNTDIIHITELFTYFIVEKYLNELPGKKILDAHNIDYLRLKSELDVLPFWQRIAGIPVYNNLKKYEIDAVRKVDYILTCSENDKEIYSHFKDPKYIKVIPNGTYLPNFDLTRNLEQEHTVLFIGLLSYSPNFIGIRWYIENVHHILKQKYSNYKLIITGMNASDWLKSKSKEDKNILLKGFVNDVRKEIAESQVCICPVFSGSGTRLKILEYMAMKKAVVSTTQGAEGLFCMNNKSILIADSSIQFARAIIQLFENKHLRNYLGKNAQDLIRCHYTWKKITNTLEIFYKNI